MEAQELLFPGVTGPLHEQRFGRSRLILRASLHAPIFLTTHRGQEWELHVSGPHQTKSSLKALSVVLHATDVLAQRAASAAMVSSLAMCVFGRSPLALPSQGSWCPHARTWACVGSMTL